MKGFNWYDVQLIKMLLGSKDWLLKFQLPRKSVTFICHEWINRVLSNLWKNGKERYVFAIAETCKCFVNLKLGQFLVHFVDPEGGRM